MVWDLEIIEFLIEEKYMKTVTTEQARLLAFAYAEYVKVRPSELNTVLDVELAISFCRNLSCAQESTGIEMASKLDRRMEQLESLKELVAA